MADTPLNIQKIFAHKEKLIQALAFNRSKGNIIPPMPIHVGLGLVNYCNHRCNFCSCADFQFGKHNSNRQAIDRSRLLYILSEMQRGGLKAVTIAGCGEPMLHPEAGAILTDIHNLGIDIGIFTNGSVLDERLAAVLIECCTFVRFSITGGSPEVHSAVHGGNDYKKVLANVAKLIKLRNNKPFPTLGIQFCIASYTVKDLYKAAITAKELGVDYFAIKAVNESGRTDLRLTNTLKPDEAIEIMNKINALEDQRFKVYGKTEQLDIVFLNSTDRTYQRCLGMCLRTEIESDLKFYACCDKKNKAHCYGDGIRDSFETIWKSGALNQLYKEINLNSCPPGYILHPLNTLMQDLLKNKQ